VVFWPKSASTEARQQVQDAESSERAGAGLLRESWLAVKPITWTWQSSRSIIGLRNHVDDILRNLIQNLGKVASWSALGLLYLALPCLFAVISIFSGFVVSDSVAQSESPFCSMKQHIAPDEKWRVHYNNMEAESARYAKSCYGSAAGDDSCNHFYRGSIQYKIQHNDTCPFPGDICYGGLFGALSLDTGLVDMETIGINTHFRHKFRRKTTCTPLRTDRGRFLELEAEDVEKQKASWLYKYGKSAEGGLLACASTHAHCTFRIPIDIVNFWRPTYQV
jgi:hypothetical protein